MRADRSTEEPESVITGQKTGGEAVGGGGGPNNSTQQRQRSGLLEGRKA